MPPSSTRQSAVTIERPSYIAWRFYLVLSIILLAVVGLALRVFELSILSQDFLRHQGDERVLRLVSTPAFRGMIVDRNGFPLAVSTSVYSAWINPQEFSPARDQLDDLARLLQVKALSITSIAKNGLKKNREFVYLKRSLSPETAAQVKSLNVPGVYLQEEYRRYYPEGEVTAQVVGITNIDDKGQEGIELAYNEWLQGEPGKKWVVKDRIGRVISDVQTLQDQRPGRDLVLSIDRRIQYLAYRELLAGVVEKQAASGSAIVLDVKTGEILAMVNVPSFNPNNRKGAKHESYRNRAVTDIFEPGSTVKAFTIASALESGRFKPDSIIDTSPGWMRVGHNVVKDKKNNGLLSLSQILQVSSNMGAAKLVLAMPPDQLWSVLNRVGFGEATGVGFPGEQTGMLIRHNPWGSFVLATLSFGYAMSATSLQLTRAYSVLANHGVKLPVSLLKLAKPPTGKQVLDPVIAREMLILLESVFAKGGSAHTISVPGYRVAGKTGTAKKAGQGGYEKHRYISSFVGIAPVSDPRLVVTVVIDDPMGKDYYGALVSGPVFQRIMSGALRLLDVPPDNESEKSDISM
ncbi:Peptidoglycan synthase FtsI [Aquicella siphonis]|uniref:Peptidoglycan D,D-transpeptidase FtsI n=1 Tax=Aquicella siphonis TaxID=254247 RepID=A0A5E4PH67_9COXI|nr:penicillin-binding transpeptidase domain-containing protein [Aquicella siphonis]VVC76349.1 Peptidoglycan synthase FtsI [Aquicella siphonis]